MIFNISTFFGQETFPLNGVKDNFNPIYAFTNAHIFITPEKKIKNGTLIVQDGKVIAADTNLIIPKDAIIKNLNGEYIYPIFFICPNSSIFKNNRFLNRQSFEPVSFIWKPN